MNISKKPLVSIGIPTYNRASRNLRNVIARALGQTYQNVEVIVSDNCSSDHTPELVQAIQDPRLRYFRQDKNIGPNNNFNYCLSQARGEYFLLFHDDDMIDEDFVEACVSSLQPDQVVGAIFTGVRVIDENNNVLEENRNNATSNKASNFILGWFKGDTGLYLCNTLYNTAKLKEIGGFGSKMNLFDDLVPTFTLVAKYGRSDVAEIKAGFRRHTSNRGATIPILHWVEDSRYLLDKLCQLLPDDRSILRERGNRYFCTMMYEFIDRGMAVSQSPLDYYKIYQAFDYCCTPLRYFYDTRYSHKLSKLKQIFAKR